MKRELITEEGRAGDSRENRNEDIWGYLLSLSASTNNYDYPFQCCTGHNVSLVSTFFPFYPTHKKIPPFWNLEPKP